MPGPAWRALLFASLVDDPGDEARRQAATRPGQRLVPADGGPPPDDVLAEARSLIAEAMDGDALPTVLDPFCGGGSTLVEAQRLGLPTVGSDLNPVPALITRVLTETRAQECGQEAAREPAAQLEGIAGGALDGLLADVVTMAIAYASGSGSQVGHLYPSQWRAAPWLRGFGRERWRARIPSVARALRWLFVLALETKRCRDLARSGRSCRIEGCPLRSLRRPGGPPPRPSIGQVPDASSVSTRIHSRTSEGRGAGQAGSAANGVALVTSRAAHIARLHPTTCFGSS